MGSIPPDKTLPIWPDETDLEWLEKSKARVKLYRRMTAIAYVLFSIFLAIMTFFIAWKKHKEG